ncbi:ABC transporter ATP-binding protein [Amycolatopsis jejuensis]|uniref:ABC transporter ATP-binding protein n=1 Tax=Amycolatopsis jejuensis TaxID=330084 RepID=UPI000525FFB8|nr:ABC transporter ATP-binding protein [Amycolatopsis jejuensis]
MRPPEEHVLDVRGLRVELASGAPIVDGLSLGLRPKEILGLVGESGSGKTTTALALLGFTRPGASIVAGDITVDGHEVLALDDRGRRALRGNVVSYVPQEPGQALNPSLRIGASITDVRGSRDTDVLQLLAAVDLPATEAFARRLPHQLSGGQQQRVTIAMAVSCGPPVIVMDEPTTGLDVITQSGILGEIRRLRDEQDAALVYVSHDLAVVSQLADRVTVLYAGRVVEEGPTAELLDRPRHPYTRGLVRSVPDLRRPTRPAAMPGTAVGVGDRPAGCAFAPRCDQRTEECERETPALVQVGAAHQVRCVHATATWPPVAVEPRPASAGTGAPLLEVRDLVAGHRSQGRRVVAADHVSFEVRTGECVALVGQSGSGKTTIARCLVGLHWPDGGRITLDGAPLDHRIRRRSVEERRRIQYVFQNPYESLNPRRSIADQLARPAQVLRGLSAADARAEVFSLLDRTRLPASVAPRYPRQLSGGERQRVAIARALAAEPEVLVCDEITSALDVSVQAAILHLLEEMREQLGLSVVLITHDLGVVSVAADRVLVLEQGVVRESGPVAQILRDPEDAYTRRLVEAAPTLNRQVRTA